MESDEILKALFVQQRIQVMHIAKHHDEYTDAYLYAWENSVYPLMSDRDNSVPALPHQCYEKYFLVSKHKVDFLSERLDKACLSKEGLTFYALESELGVRSGSSNWERTDLLAICRYLFLDGCFDDDFWKVLHTNGQCPTEAHSITRKFDRLSDVSFM